jgi:hypothetical protein
VPLWASRTCSEFLSIATGDPDPLGGVRAQLPNVLSKDSLAYVAFFAFLARRFSLRVLPATFFVLLPPLSLFAIGVLQTGDRSGNREPSVSHHHKRA